MRFASLLILAILLLTLFQPVGAVVLTPAGDEGASLMALDLCRAGGGDMNGTAGAFVFLAEPDFRIVPAATTERISISPITWGSLHTPVPPDQPPRLA